MTFKYKIMERYTRRVMFVTNNFEIAQKIVSSQDRGNMNRRLLILREKM